MTTYNIYTYDNASDNPPLLATVVISDDDSEIVSITSENPDTKREAQEVLSTYIRHGFTASEAVSRYAGSYGNVKEAGVEEPTGSAPAPEAAPEEATA